MWTTALLFLSAALPSAAPASTVLPTAESEPLSYTLRPDPQAGTLRVELTWETRGRTQSTLKVLERWASIDDVAALFGPVQFGPEVQARRSGRQWHVQHRVGERITARYEVACATGRMEWDAVFRPTIAADFFHAIGTTFLLTPDTGAGVPKEFDVVLRWALPADWPAAVCSWGVGAHVGATMSTSDLLHSVYYVGRLDTHTQDVLGQPLTVALRDAFDFDARRLSEMAGRIVAAQRQFMNDAAFPPFVVTAVPVGERLEAGTTRLQGSGLYRSFTAFMPPGARIDDSLEHLFAHELFHYWNGRILDREKPEEQVYWFSEGVTDYYALRILFESGQWDAPLLARWINRHVAAYQRNPARNATNADIQREFWSKRNTVGEVAYQRGLLLGLRWHRLARDHGVPDGLDRLLHALVQRARTAGLRISNANLRAAGVELLGEWFGPDFDRFVLRAETVELPRDALAPQLVGEPTTVYDYVLGFDQERSIAERRVIGLVAGSEAEKAGLREGDRIEGWSHFPDPERPTVLEVRRDGRQRTVRFFPRGPAMTVIQFRPVAEAPTSRPGRAVR